MYELIKKLKESGFPQEKYNNGYYFVLRKLPDNREVFIIQYRIEDESRKDLYFYVPTLSELIEECGDNFWALYRARHGEYTWSAHSSSDQWDTEISHGKTPEETLINLYLELKK